MWKKPRKPVAKRTACLLFVSYTSWWTRLTALACRAVRRSDPEAPRAEKASAESNGPGWLARLGWNLLWFDFTLPLCFAVRCTPRHVREWMIVRPAARLMHLSAGASTRVLDQMSSRSSGSPVEGKRVRPSLEMYRSLVRMGVDAMFMVAASPQAVHKSFGRPSVPDIKALLSDSSGQFNGGVVGFTHQGSFVSGAVALAMAKVPVTVVMFDHNPLIRRVLDRVCSKYGFNVQLVPRSLGSGALLRRSIAAVLTKQAVAIATDFAAPGRGVKAKLAGDSHLVGLGPAYMSLASGAPVAVFGVLQHGVDREFVVSEPVRPAKRVKRPSRADAEELTPRIAIATEQVISAAPEQWFCMGRVGDMPGLISDPLGIKTRRLLKRSAKSNVVTTERPHARTAVSADGPSLTAEYLSRTPSREPTSFGDRTETSMCGHDQQQLRDGSSRTASGQRDSIVFEP